MAIRKFRELDPTQHVDYAIIGAGISGLYMAWSINQAQPDKTIAIVERLNRTGGRLDTDIIEVKPGQLVREEEGGMRFQYSMHELMSLTNAMGLCDQIVPFPMASDLGEDGNTNRFWLRGQRFTAQEAESGGNLIWGLLYNLKEDEKGKSPADIIADVYDAVLAHNGATKPDEQTPDYWTELRNSYVWNNTLLRDWQMWGLLRDMDYSEECIQMLSETIGFAGPFKAPINAGDAFQILADFPKDPTYFTFQRGFSTLPDAVRDALPEDKIDIMLSTFVDSVEQKDDGFLLKMTEAPDELNSAPHIPGGEIKTVSAGKLIIATASQSMESLFHTSPALNQTPTSPKLLTAMRSSRGMRLLKINLYFNEPWWQEQLNPAIQFGPNFTNLPVNAIYPFYSLPDDAKSDMATLSSEEASEYKAAALTIYCDFENTAFWQGLQNVGDKFRSPLQEKQSQPPQTLFPASLAVVAEARKQLSQLFGLADIPSPVLTSYRLWDGQDDFEYAYHQWRLSVDDISVRDYLANPMTGVYCCNEAISDMQGWVNGSLRSCNMALSKMEIPIPASPGCTKADPEMASLKTTKRRIRSGLWGG